ncbi:MAG: HlyD family secretion protein [Paramuribaculum sp.]|nr:HlyD family secretion protein [Paramuribaculum sp.]
MKSSTKIILSTILSILVIIGAALWVIFSFLHLGDVEFTDNAQIKQQIVPVNSRVQGYIKEIRFNEYEPVKKGDTLIIIDDSDLRLNVAKARAEYQNALAGKNITGKTVASASANLGVSEATIEEARIMMDLSHKDLERYENLLAQGAVTRQQYDGAKADYEAKRARYETLKRQRNATSSVVEVNRSQLSSSDASIDLAKALLESAELNLTYTVITAPCDGYTSRKEIQVGLLVQPGQTLLDIVDASDIWVTANYKETQLKHIRPGSEVEIEVDAVPNVKYYGVVKSISTATGAALSIIPQDNSAGNFVKVRQRVPVRIDFTDKNSPEDMELLRAGMNVECLVKY